jgi:hypothetical protein
MQTESCFHSLPNVHTTGKKTPGGIKQASLLACLGGYVYTGGAGTHKGNTGALEGKRAVSVPLSRTDGTLLSC